MMQDDYLEELNITTYNTFKDYLFWDVIEALTKVHLVNTDMRSDCTKLVTDQDITFRSEGSNYEDKSIMIGGPLESGGDKTLSTKGNNITSPSKKGNSSSSKMYKKKHSMSIEQRNHLRIELEFENLDQKMQDVMDVEEIKRKESRIKKSYVTKQDEMYTSAHIKAGRKIMQALKRLRDRKAAAAMREGLSASKLLETADLHKEVSIQNIKPDRCLRNLSPYRKNQVLML